eukprot:TRINITY_DN1834_c0_g1_i1.p3 TRINITY_DN1834_c0_g1~~TRINITY_DN1834_c0_g1_i1.p3  ORF type:complete len:147 (-),score=16.80 TRINITY_DN1834_c0_g1_i1:249-689(-)
MRYRSFIAMQHCTRKLAELSSRCGVTSSCVVFSRGMTGTADRLVNPFYGDTPYAKQTQELIKSGKADEWQLELPPWDSWDAPEYHRYDDINFPFGTYLGARGEMVRDEYLANYTSPEWRRIIRREKIVYIPLGWGEGTDTPRGFSN